MPFNLFPKMMLRTFNWIFNFKKGSNILLGKTHKASRTRQTSVP